MRITALTNVHLADQTPHSLTFRGEHDEVAQITVLDHDLIRVRVLPDGTARLNRTWMISGDGGDVPLKGRSRDDLTPFPLSSFTQEVGEDGLSLKTDALRLDLNFADMALTWTNNDGHAFANDLSKRAYSYDRGGKTVFHHMHRRMDEHYYGFGEKAGPLDKVGMRMRMVCVDAMGYSAKDSDPLYKHFPFYITYLPDLDIAYGMFYDNLADSVFDLGKEINATWGPYHYYEAADGDIDYTLIYGPTIADVVAKLSKLIGYPVLMPRWTLGYLGSTMYYTDLPNAQEALKTFVDQCGEHDIPCDGFHLSSGYTMDETDARYVFTWDKKRVPDPHAMTQYFADAGMHLAANVKPHLLISHPYYEDVKAQDGFIKEANSDAPELVERWRGGVYTSELGAHIDFTNNVGFDWWKGKITEALLEYGVDSIWNDNNEYEVWDDMARGDGYGETIRMGISRPLQTMLMGRASFEAMQEHKPDTRPYLITRSGCPGIQRYAQTWSGDNTSTWEDMRYNTPMGLGMSLSGMPNIGHDVGGFFGENPDPVLFLRWIQAGIFHPRFTMHSLGLGGMATEPWMYPDILPVVRETFRLRYQLIPYLYTLLAESSRTGQPIIRPLVYHFSQDENTHTESFDFMLGSHLLVAPVYDPLITQRFVYLPKDNRWCDVTTGAWHEGGQVVGLDAALERIPLLGQAGGIVALGKPMRHVGAEADDYRAALIFPGPAGGEGAFTLVEDDGISLGYQRGEQTRFTLRIAATESEIAVSVDAPDGGYALPYNSVDFILPPGEKRPVSGGEKVSDAIIPDVLGDAPRRVYRVAVS